MAEAEYRLSDEGEAPPKRRSLTESKDGLSLQAEIQGGVTLRQAESPRQGAEVTETFARGALLNELRKGKELKQAERKASMTPQNSQTMARAGLLNELQR